LPEMKAALGLDGSTNPAVSTTTLAPTTLAPTTLAPTTLAPTTLAPTTLAPTTSTTTALTGQVDPTDLTIRGRTVLIRSTCDKRKVLDVRKLSREPGAVIQLYWTNRVANQRFLLQHRDGNRFQITNEYSGLAMGAESDSQGIAVTQRSITSVSSDNWDVVRVASNRYEFYRPNTNLALDLQWSNTVEGTPMQLWARNSSCAQQFSLDVVG
jgi:hypothetical protein